MSKSSKDVKFIIYQVLYIFVIVVLTMKGADIDLTQVLNKDLVIMKDSAVTKTYADSLKAYIDSLTARGLTPAIEIKDKPQNLADLKVVIDGIKLLPGQRIVNSDYIDPIKDTKTDPTKEPEKQIELKIVQPTQFTINNIKNNNSEALQIFADNNLIQTIPANGSGSYQLKGEKTVRYVCGNTKRDVETLPNQTQKLSFQSFGAGSADASLRSLQSVVGWRVTVDDDFIDQIDVKITGSVKAKQVAKGVYDIQLSICSSKDQFEKMFENKEAPYVVSFNVVTTDKISGKVVNQQRTFTFGGW